MATIHPLCDKTPPDTGLGDEILDGLASETQWRLITSCAICSQRLEGVATRGAYLSTEGVAIIRMHHKCAARVRVERELRRQFVARAGRSITLTLGEVAGHA